MTHPHAPVVPPEVIDPERLASLHRVGLLDTPPDESFDRLTRVATRALGVPVALVSLVDADRQFFKSCVGLPEPWASRRETPLSHSFCQFVVEQSSELIISDAREHPLVRDNRAIPDLGVIAYAGIPLPGPGGMTFGSFCAIDTEPREWSEDDLALLRDLAGAAADQIAYHGAAVWQRRRLRQIFDHVPAGVVVTRGPDHRIDMANPAARRLLDPAQEEFEGRPYGEVFATGLGVGEGGVFSRVLASGDVVHGVEWEGDSDDGPGRSYDLAFVPLSEAEGGAPEGVLMHAVEVTEKVNSRRALESQATHLNRMAEELSRRNRELERYSAAVSHDLRAPLRNLSNLLDWLVADYDHHLPEEAQKLTALMQSRVQRLHAMVEGLLEYARRTGTRGEVETVDLAATIRTLVDLHTRSGDLEVDVDVDASGAVAMEALPFEQAVQNLVSNAVKFAESRVAVRARVEDGWVHVSVVDDGPGIPEAERERIWDMFHTGSGDQADKGGTGIGLALVRALVEDRGGRIGLTCDERGTRFTFTWPLAH